MDGIIVSTPVNGVMQQFCQISKLTVHVPDQIQKLIHVNIFDTKAVIPYGFELANIIENASSNIKAIKHLLRSHLGFVFDGDEGLRYHFQNELSKKPTVNIKIENFMFDIEDEKFEANFLITLFPFFILKSNIWNFKIQVLNILDAYI